MKKQEMIDTTEAGMTAAANGQAEILGIEVYEARIRLYKEQAVSGFIGIGRTLTEAKAAGVVPHGQWEAWVEKTTGMGIRQAQRCMQAAAEIRDGSWLGRLDMGKAMMLLSSGLEDGQRETLARRAAEEGATERQLREEIRRIREKQAAADAENEETVKALKLQVVKESGTAAEIRAALKQAESDRESLKNQLAATIEAYQKRLDDAAGDAYRRGLQEKAAGMEQDIRKEFQGKVDHINSERKQAEERIRSLQADLDASRKDGSARWDEGYQAAQNEIIGLRNELNKQTQYAKSLAEKMDEIDEQHQRDLADCDREAREEERAKIAAEAREIETLRAELEAAEAREAKKARELAELKREKTQARMDGARGIRVDEDGLDLAAAVRQFIGSAGALPQMGQLLAGLTESEREALRAQVETVARWVRDARTALGTVIADASIE